MCSRPDAPVALVVLFALSISFVLIQDNRERSRQSISSLRVDVVERRKETIRQHVDLVLNEIDYQKTQTRKILEHQAKQRVEEAHAIAENIYRTNLSKSKQEITQLISEALRPIRFFEGRGYFFVFQMDGINIMHGLRPEMEGRSGWNGTDIRGTYILQEHIKLIKENGEAFYRWWYPKPGEPKNQEFEKVGFGKLFAPYNWFIGTGEYLADVENDVKQQVISWINDYSYGVDGYIFILDKEGIVLSHREPRYIGKKMTDLSSSSTVNTKALLSEAKQNKGFVQYYLPLQPDANVQREKLSYVTQVEDWGWVVGSGFYLSEFEAYLDKQEALLQEQNKIELIKVLFISAVATG